MSDFRVVIFTGARRSTRRLRTAAIREVRAEQDLAIAAGKRLFVAVGDCPTGLDGYIRAWCARNLPKSGWIVYRADWARNGHAGGPIRNRDMCRAHPEAEAVVAFPASWDREESKGTWDCLDAAEELKLPIRIVPPEVWS